MRGLLSLLFLITLSATAPAQDSYPNRPIKLLIPFPPAGITDLSGRLIADALRARFNQPVIVENKPGANGVIGLRDEEYLRLKSSLACSPSSRMSQNHPLDFLKSL